MYDPETNQWTIIAPMRSRRSGVSCIAYHNHVYVIGNYSKIKYYLTNIFWNQKSYNYFA